MFPRPPFFAGARLNFAENLLYPSCNPDENSFAVIEATEQSRNHVTWKELRERVCQCSIALRRAGVKRGDRVAGYVANHCNALVAMLSATAIGALWTAMSSDSGVHAVLDRIQQIEPTVLFADNATMYKGKVHDMHDKLKDLVQQLPHLKACVIFETIGNREFDMSDVAFADGTACSHNDFVQLASNTSKLDFEQLEPDHPVYILYSSGTTVSSSLLLRQAFGD